MEVKQESEIFDEEELVIDSEEERRAKIKYNEKMQRKYERELWAIIGMKEHNFEFKTVLTVYDRFVKLDLVPTHYNYPEFYRFWYNNFTFDR